MSTESNFYLRSDEEKYKTEDVDSKKCIYWKNHRDLNDMLRLFGKRVKNSEIEDGETYTFDKEVIYRIVEYLMETTEIVLTKAINTINRLDEIEDYSEDSSENTQKILRDYYVEGRNLAKVKQDIWEERNYHCFNIHDEYDDQGYKLCHLLMGLVGFLARWKENDVAILRIA